MILNQYWVFFMTAFIFAEITAACPSYSTTNTIFEKWRKKHNNRKYLMLKKYDENMKCKTNSFPASVNEPGKSHCFVDNEQQKGQKYEVGYWVWDDKLKNFTFVSIYSVCYSEAEGVLYTVHRLGKGNDSLKLLSHLRIYEPNYFQESTTIDAHYKEPGNGMKKHQLVPRYDLPLRTWQLTTLFRFNTINVSKDIFNHLQDVNYYIRGTIIEMDYAVIVYSGLYRHMLSENDHYLFAWKVLHNNSNTAIAFISLIEPTDKCFKLCDNISQEYEWTFLSNPVVGSCSYACHFDDSLKNKFGLMTIKSSKTLLRFIKNTETTKSSKRSSGGGGGGGGYDGSGVAGNTSNTANSSFDGGNLAFYAWVNENEQAAESAFGHDGDGNGGGNEGDGGMGGCDG